jgi:hypothetical protein
VTAYFIHPTGLEILIAIGIAPLLIPHNKRNRFASIAFESRNIWYIEHRQVYTEIDR